jgi:hypothetical protein
MRYSDDFARHTDYIHSNLVKPGHVNRARSQPPAFHFARIETEGLIRPRNGVSGL